MFSHIAVVEKKNRNLWSYHVVLYTGMFLLLGGLAAIWATGQAFIGKVWDNIIYFIASIIGRVTYLFQFVSDISNGTEVVDVRHG